MRITIVNGSPRRRGATAKVLHAMQERAIVRWDAEVAYFDLGDYEMRYCDGCTSCYRTGRCHKDDGLEEVLDVLAASEGLVLGTPTYSSNVSGVMKTFIDRGHFIMERALQGRHAVTVATGGNRGAGRALGVLRQLVVYSGGRVSDSISAIQHFNTDPLADSHRRHRVERATDRLCSDILSPRHHPLQTMESSLVFNVGIKPHVLAEAEGYSAVIASWKRRGID